MNLRKCPNCGAPLPASASGAVESCRFCEAEGRSCEPATARHDAAASLDASFVVDEAAIATLCARYVESVKAYVQKKTVDADESLMRGIEDKTDIPDSRRDDFRREVVTFVTALAAAGAKFESTTNPRIRKALELVLFEDAKRVRA